jgi:lipoprotein-anchoring transpeptidase ErfK/SrfK
MARWVRKTPGFLSGDQRICNWRVVVVVLRRLLLFGLIAVARAQETAPPTAAALPRPVESVLELQVELHRRGFSCGAIDGVPGPQTAAALRGYQRAAGIRETGTLDAATREWLVMSEPVLTGYVLTSADLAELRPLSPTWLGKSQQPALGYATVLEQLAERHRAHPKLLQRLNPEVTDWSTLLPDAVIQVPAVEAAVVTGRPAQIAIRLEARELELFDADGRVIAHFPVSIARAVEKRLLGELRVTVAIPDPNYTFDPVVFPESAEGKQLGRKLILPPGPNNPVGRVWIGLDRPGYGIHGTPDPEKVGRTESHGCFRLANWDALTLLKLVRVGMIVVVEP